MSVIQKFKNPVFWKNVFKIAIPFLVLVTVFSLVFKTGSALFSGDLETVNAVHFADGKSLQFWFPKVIISVGYAMYLTSKKMK